MRVRTGSTARSGEWALAGRTAAAHRVDEEAHLHEVLVGLRVAGGLHDKDIAVADGLVHLHVGLAVHERLAARLPDRAPEQLRHLIREPLVRTAREYLHRPVGRLGGCAHLYQIRLIRKVCEVVGRHGGARRGAQSQRRRPQLPLAATPAGDEEAAPPPGRGAQQHGWRLL